MTGAGERRTKYREIYQHLYTGIVGGRYIRGQRIPSETELCERFAASRITVGKALRELELQGYLERRRGSGSYVRIPEHARTYTFGLLVPSLGEGEIFEPVCNAIAIALAERHHRLLWGQFPMRDMAERCQQAERLCQQYIDEHVDGVFVAPIETAERMEDVNAHIVALLEQAGIPIVLLDWDIAPFPTRSRFDLVGVDNRRIGYRLATHFLERGCQKIVFVCRPRSAQTVHDRIAGYREALADRGVAFQPAWVQQGEPTDMAFLTRVLQLAPEAVICGNDYTAAMLIGGLLRRGVRVPDDIRVAGVDDLKYASLLHVPLTTVRQPCAAMGHAAVEAMLQRIATPALPARDIFLETALIVRESSGC